MTRTKQMDSNWLKTDTSQAQASVKYDIKQLEGKLAHELYEVKDLSLIVTHLIITCELLSQRYADYLQILEKKKQSDLLHETAYLHCTTWLTCYNHIQLLKHQLANSQSMQETSQRLGFLSRQYQHLCSLLALSAIKFENKLEQSEIFPALKNVLMVDSPPKWLNAVVQFANLVEGAIPEYLSHFSTLNDQQLLHLSHVFNQQDHIHIMSAIFFYKLHPQKLFDAILHPEKLISAKKRLTLLYDFVELFHQSLVQALALKGLHISHDYLFHGEELPQGIEIAMRDDYRAPIVTAIKSWRVKIVPINEEHLNLYQLDDMDRAYKFWFNPDRLIDAAMRLEQRINAQKHPSDNYFYQQMITLYQQITTSKCLDLYGYFSNNDSSYLMRTLLVVKQDAVFSWLSPLTHVERSAITRVYNILEAVMNALRDELAKRKITTSPYKRSVPTNEMTPGRRNRNAVIRIIMLYSEEVPDRMSQIDQLFKSVET